MMNTQSPMIQRMLTENVNSGHGQPEGSAGVEVLTDQTSLLLANNDEIAKLDCVFCEFKFPCHLMTNYGTKDYPKWTCKPCLASSRWNDKVMTSKALVPADEKKKNPKKYQRRVLAGRIQSKDDPEEVKAAFANKNLQDRRRKQAEFDEVEARERVYEEAEDIKYLNKDMFVQFQITECGKKPKDAEELWDRVDANPEIASRKNRAGDITYPVSMPLVVSMRKRRKMGEYLHVRSQPEESDEEAEWLSAQSQKLNDSTGVVQLPFFPDQANPFSSGAAFVPPLKAEASPAKAGKTLTAAALSTHEGASDCASSISGDSPSVVGSVVFAMIPTSVTDARGKAKALEKNLKSKTFKNKASAYASLAEVIAKLGESHVEVVALAVQSHRTSHKALIDKLAESVEDANHWDGGYQDKYTQFMGVVSEAQKSDESLKEKLKKLKAISNTQVKDTTNESRNASIKIRALTKVQPLPPQGFPNTALTWFGESVLGVTSTADFNGGNTSAGLTSTDVDEIEDFTTIHLWRKGSISDVLTEFVESVDKWNVKAARDALANDFDAAKKITLPINMAMIPPLGKSSASLLPTQFLEEKSEYKVTQSSGVYGPWLFGSKQFGFRCASQMVPFDAIPSFLFVHEGSMAVLMTSIATLLKKGSTIRTFRSSIGGLTPSEAKRFMEAECKFVTLCEGDLLFVPPGFVAWYVGLNPSPSFAVHVPVLSEKLYRSLPQELRSSIIENMKAMLDNPISQRVWGKCAPTILRWLHCE